jgi:hypothetical protein
MARFTCVSPEGLNVGDIGPVRIKDADELDCSGCQPA